MASAAPATMAKRSPEAGPADAVAMRQKQADAGQEQEARGDAAGVELPAADGRQARVDIAEEFEVPGEVIARHGEQRDAARDVDGVDALSGLLLVWHVSDLSGGRWIGLICEITVSTARARNRNRKVAGSSARRPRPAHRSGLGPECAKRWPARICAAYRSVSCYRLGPAPAILPVADSCRKHGNPGPASDLASRRSGRPARGPLPRSTRWNPSPAPRSPASSRSRPTRSCRTSRPSRSSIRSWRCSACRRRCSCRC